MVMGSSTWAGLSGYCIIVIVIVVAVDALALARLLDAVSSSLLVSSAPGAVRARRAWSQRQVASSVVVHSH